MINLQQRDDGTLHLVNEDGVSLETFKLNEVLTSTAAVMSKSGLTICNPSSVAIYTLDTPVLGSRKRIKNISSSTACTITPQSTLTFITSTGATTALFTAKGQALELEAYQSSAGAAIAWAVINNFAGSSSVVAFS